MKKYFLTSTVENYRDMSILRDNNSEDYIVLLDYTEDTFSIQQLFNDFHDNHALHIMGWLAENGDFLEKQYIDDFDQQFTKEDGSVIQNYDNEQHKSDYFYHDRILRLIVLRDENEKESERLYLNKHGNIILKTKVHWDNFSKKYLTDSFEFKFNGQLEQLGMESEFIHFFLNHFLQSDNDSLIIDGNQYTETLINYETNLQKFFYINQMNKNNLLMIYEYAHSGITILVNSDREKSNLIQQFSFPVNSIITYHELINKKYSMIKRSSRKVVGVLTGGVSPKAGGLTGALYKRIKFLKEMGYQPLLLTFANQDSVKLYEDSVKVGRAVKNPVYNLWSFLRSRTVFFESERMNPEMLAMFNQEMLRGITNISIVEKDNDINVKFSYIKGKIYRFNGFSDSSIFLKETFENNILKKREYYNKYGIKVRQTTLLNGKVENTESFYYEGKLFLTTGRIFNNVRKKYFTTWYEIPVIDGKRRFNAYYELQIYFMSRHFAYANALLFVEHPTIYTAVSKWQTRHYINVVFHSTHLTYGTNKLKGAYDRVVDQLNRNINQIIVLTKSAKSDLDARVSDSIKQNIIVEPHTIEKKDILVPFEKRPDYTAISLGRLDKDKRVNDVIQAFGSVVKHFPQAELFIYGEGPEKNNLIELVEELGIQGSVKFMGFTHETDNAFQHATVHLFTSKFEGFGLTLLESLANGTPNISYAVDYGPREFVNSESLVSDGDVNEFSNKIMEIFNHPENKVKRSERAINFSGKYTDKDYYNQLMLIVEKGFES
ncbi:glycosyltransferase [Weissella fangxianensis]|uniref:glycosyltransferase n=1 Tax=Weissella fangxianensis TaxID=2953879 RepID=UPI002157707F|nr:glycosyltransferase [Weissella fangxianensis]